MLGAQSPRWLHAAQNIALILLSIIFQPVNLAILFASFALGTRPKASIARERARIQKNGAFRQRTILVTGVGMTKGLTLARLFHKAGHRVVGADFDANACGSVSNCLDIFYQLAAPTGKPGSSLYVEGLLRIILQEKVDLWVSCSGVASAVEDGEAMETVERSTECRAVQFNVKMTKILHEKDTFIDYVRKLGLTVPETHIVTSVEAAEKALDQAPAGRKYIMKPIGMDDTKRGDMTFLPKAQPKDTHQHLVRSDPSTQSPFILQQFIQGSEYCTHALVVRGKVKAFVACPSLELLMHYEALPTNSALSRAMLAFTTTVAAKSGEDFTGHLSFDFLVEDVTPTDPKDIVLYPIECNPRAHTAVVLFSQTPEMVDAYLTLVADADQALDNEKIVVPRNPRKYYWIGHDLVALIGSKPSLSEAKTVLQHILTWHDGTFELTDPLPWFWLYHVFWPLQFLQALITGKRWSRVNVSTGKVFKC